MRAGSPAPGRERGGRHRHRLGVRRRSCGRAGGHGRGPGLLGAARCGAVRCGGGVARRCGLFPGAPGSGGTERDRLAAAVAACVPGAGGSAAAPAAHPAPRFPLPRAGGSTEVSRAAGLGAGLGGGARDSSGAGAGSGRRTGGPGGSGRLVFCLKAALLGAEGPPPARPPASQRAGSLASAPACRPVGPGARFSWGDGSTFSPCARAFSSLASTDFANRPDRIWTLRLRGCTKLRFPLGAGGERGFSGRVSAELRDGS